jgi:hypothetical protein
MSLSLPTPDDLNSHKEGVDEATALQRAADLFVIATGVTENPTDPIEVRLIKTAILDMAWFLQEDHENREAQFSPFSSERIGSYSYTKMQAAVRAGDVTGVSGFDQAVDYFNDKNSGSTIWSTSEWVFENGYRGSDAPRYLNHDPSYTYYPDAIPFPDAPPYTTEMEQ